METINVNVSDIQANYGNVFLACKTNLELLTPLKRCKIATIGKIKKVPVSYVTGYLSDPDAEELSHLNRMLDGEFELCYQYQPKLDITIICTIGNLIK